MHKIENYIIICDESVKKGKFYSYFYGGALIKEKDYEDITLFFNMAKKHYGLNELKRTKITPKNYLDYIQVLKIAFNFIKAGTIRVRVMFSPNNQLIVLPKIQDESYSKLYYTFIKNAFSLYYTNFDIKLRLIFDQLPDQKEKNNKFKAYLCKNLKHANKYKNKILTGWKFIEEVDSQLHPVLQCVDVITGVIESHLNQEGPPLSKRAQAREKVFNYIAYEINQIHENFVLTETTRPIYSYKGFLDSYKHFVYKKKAPDAPT